MDQTLGFLDQLKEQHHEVASKTRQLHDKCERLVRHLSSPCRPALFGTRLKQACDALALLRGSDCMRAEATGCQHRGELAPWSGYWDKQAIAR